MMSQRSDMGDYGTFQVPSWDHPTAAPARSPAHMYIFCRPANAGLKSKSRLSERSKPERDTVEVARLSAHWLFSSVLAVPGTPGPIAPVPGSMARYTKLFAGS